MKSLTNRLLQLLLVLTSLQLGAQTASKDIAVARERLSLDNGWRFHLGDVASPAIVGHGMSYANAKAGRAWGAAAFWKDPDGIFWLYGGRSNTASDGSNDLWKYNVTTNEWTYMKGHSPYNSYSMYVTKGMELTNIQPKPRTGGSSWVDAMGSLWIFGGYACCDSAWLNDVWKYNRSTNNWTWIKGDSTLNSKAVYGVKGIPSPNNTPRSRASSVSWIDSTGNFWLFGGRGGYSSPIRYAAKSDLWQFTPGITASNALPVQLLTFIANKKDKAVELQWTTENEINFDSYYVERCYDSRNFEAIGNLKAKNSTAKQSYNYIDPSPLFNNSIYYRLKMTSKDGSFTYSFVIVIKNSSDNKFTIYPNPASTDFQIEVDKSVKGRIDVEIADIVGKVVIKKVYDSDGSALRVSTNKLTAGIYTVKLTYKKDQFFQKLLITN